MCCCFKVCSFEKRFSNAEGLKREYISEVHSLGDLLDWQRGHGLLPLNLDVRVLFYRRRCVTLERIEVWPQSLRNLSKWYLNLQKKLIWME